MGIAGMAAGGFQALQQQLMQAFEMEQAKQRMALAQQEEARRGQMDMESLGLRQREMDMQQRAHDDNHEYRTQQLERQRLADAQASSAKQNATGMRRMIGDFLQQRGNAPLDLRERNALSGMAISEDIDLPRNLTDVPEDPTLGHTQRLAEIEAQNKGRLDAIAAQGRASRQPAGTPQQDWVLRGGQVTPIAKGTAQIGDEPYDPVAARQQQPSNNPDDAKGLVQTAWDLADRMEKSPDMGASTGAYDIRGAFGGLTQGVVNFNAMREQLVAALALPNLGALKGPMSDKDVAFVKNISTRLGNTRLSEAETRRAIAEAKLFLQSKGATPGGDANPGTATTQSTPAAVGEYDFVPGKGLVKRAR